MHPPFYIVDHRVGAPSHAPTPPRRSAPARLDLRPVSANWPPVPFAAAVPTLRPDPARIVWLVPPPRGVRARLGLLLIRAGRRMIAPHPPRQDLA
ncbi:hypothetical protein EU805_00045 [Salipiger sp. IMCC34102]|uniref:hypothetical protein n=1 Tax=Salipiger sp. IMCC34102 TaxID=2510647 RepID=UPI00101D55C0|nr:hypothetical protein [Salipiger sp. IMCC34102]RYH03800.1 hypothetical protein EU805_00045 [Salipiger sp. IMCC34102]